MNSKVETCASLLLPESFLPASISYWIPPKLLGLYKLMLFTLFMRFPTRQLRETFFYIFHRDQIEATIPVSFMTGLLYCLQVTEVAQGDVIELGTYRGGSAVMMARFLKFIGSKKKIYACDTFRGHPYNDRYSPNKRKGQYSNVSVPYVLDKFLRFGVRDNIKIIKGKFENTLYRELRENRFSLAFLDCDLYDSTSIALRFLYPRMADNAMIVLRGYGNREWGWGLTKAAHDYSQLKRLKINLYPIPHIRIDKNRRASNLTLV